LQRECIRAGQHRRGRESCLDSGVSVWRESGILVRHQH
jgi:hypothetical protein